MKTRPTIGIVAICKNEERDLPGFLENLLPWVDEIVLVDDSSTDRTVEIARGAGSKVTFIEHPMSDETGFAGQRNVGIEGCTCGWILNMDVDERVPTDLAEEIRQVIADTKLNGFRYRRLNFFMHRPMKGGGWTNWNNPQLARRGCHRYKNKVHERCVVEGEPASIGQLQNKMWHLNDESYQERLRKSFQYCQMEAGKMAEAGGPFDIAQGKRMTAAKIVFRPLVVFAKKFFAKRGFRDGVPGLISAMHAACAEFRACALVWDKQNRIPRNKIEAELRAAEPPVNE